MDEKPIPFRSASTTPGERLIDKPELPKQGFAMHLVADTETIPGELQLRLGRFMDHQIYSDEPEHIGGQDRYPPADELHRDGGGLLTTHPDGAVRAHDEDEGRAGELPGSVRLRAPGLGPEGHGEHDLGGGRDESGGCLGRAAREDRPAH